VDNAVALVETYLRVNGYFTIAEYPVVEASLYGSFQTRTDIDIMAFRFPGAGRLVSGVIERHGQRGRDAYAFAPDAELASDGVHPDMLIGEVKEGRAALNPAMRDPAVLLAALARFGCGSGEVASQAVQALLNHGSTLLPSGHRARMAVFGSETQQHVRGVALQISMGHIVGFLEDYIREYWSVLRHAQFKDPTLSFLLTIEKARLGDRTAEGDSPPS